MARFPFSRRNRRKPYEYEPPVAPAYTAVDLFNRSGFEAFEHGQNLFDAPVLVYEAASSHRWPGFRIGDHRALRLGISRTVSDGQRTPALFPSAVLQARSEPSHWIEICDHAGLPALTVTMSLSPSLSPSEPQSKSEPTSVSTSMGHQDVVGRIEGRGRADIVTSSQSYERLNIEADGERYGTLHGTAPDGIASSELTVLDHFERWAATIRTVESGRSGASESFVMSVNPSLEGELRRVLVALPVVVTVLRVMQSPAMRSFTSVNRWR